MKWSQQFFLAGLVCIAPHMSPWLAVAVGGGYAVIGFCMLWKGE